MTYVLAILLMAIGWGARWLWERRHPSYIILPDLRDDGSDNTVVLQRAIDLMAQGMGRARKGLFRIDESHLQATKVAQRVSDNVRE